MFIKRAIAIGVIISSLGIMAAEAQSLRNARTPSNFPPAGFKGKQFVDARGCAFIRAGVDGAATWVPRVSRARKQVCNLKPTFARNASASAPAPQARAPEIIQVAPQDRPVATAATAPVIAAPKPRITRPATQSVIRRPAPQARPRTVAKAPLPRTGTPPGALPNTLRKPAPVAPISRATTLRTVVRPSNRCPNRTGVSAYYAGKTSDVRCGPQASLQSPAPQNGMIITREPVTVMRSGKPVTVHKRVVTRVEQPQQIASLATRTATQQARILRRNAQTGRINAPGNTRVIPRHVYEQQASARTRLKIPAGYRQARENNDRYNPKRAHMTVDGIRQTDMIWTRTVPRRLVKRTVVTGQ